MRDRKRVDGDIRGGREELRRVEEGETIVRSIVRKKNLLISGENVLTKINKESVFCGRKTLRTI